VGTLGAPFFSEASDPPGVATGPEGVIGGVNGGVATLCFVCNKRQSIQFGINTPFCVYAGERGFEISKELLRVAAVCTICFNNSKNPRLLHTVAVLRRLRLLGLRVRIPLRAWMLVFLLCVV